MREDSCRERIRRDLSQAPLADPRLHGILLVPIMIVRAHRTMWKIQLRSGSSEFWLDELLIEHPKQREVACISTHILHIPIAIPWTRSFSNQALGSGARFTVCAGLRGRCARTKSACAVMELQKAAFRASESLKPFHSHAAASRAKRPPHSSNDEAGGEFTVQT